MDRPASHHQNGEGGDDAFSVSHGKYIVLFFTGIITALLVFIVIMAEINRRAVQQHEEMFLEQQKLQAFLARQAIEDRIRWLLAESGSLASYSLPEFVQGKRDLNSLNKLFHTEQLAHPNEFISHIYLDSPDHVVCGLNHQSQSGAEAKRIALEWGRDYWSELSVRQEGPLIPSFHVTRDFQMFGMLWPIRTDDRFRGVLAITADLKPMIAQYIVPMRSGQYGAGYLLDERGTVLYDHEAEIIGRNVFNGIHAAYTELTEIDKRLVSEPSGTDHYVFTVKRGERESRKLIVWDTAAVRHRRLVVCLSAPDIEINRDLYTFWLQRNVSGGLLILILLFMTIIFFKVRQGILEKGNRALQTRVRERTRALAESERQYRMLFEFASDAVLLIREDRVIDCNQKTLEIFRCSRDEIIGKCPWSFSPPTQPDGTGSEEKGKAILATVYDGTSCCFEWEHRRFDGTLFSAEVSLNFNTLRIGEIAQAIVRDISERKAAEAERARLEARLYQARKIEAIATLAGGIAHQFNNALAGITLGIDLLTMTLPHDTAVRGHTDAMTTSAQRMAELSAQLLAYAQGGKYHSKVICLSAFVRETLPLIRHTISPTVAVETVLPSDIRHIEADLTQLEMVLSAILTNAAEACGEEGQIRITCANEFIGPEHPMKADGVRAGDYARMTVTDTGKGMDQEARQRIFEPFYSTKSPGRGLGMAAAYGIIRNHNGWLSIDSEIGNGTVVSLWLPAVEAGESKPKESGL